MYLSISYFTKARFFKSKQKQMIKRPFINSSAVQCKDELSATMFGQMKHTWLSCCQREAACQRICLTGTNKQLWGAWKGPKLWPSPMSRLPASAIKVRQSFTLACLHLWRCAPPRRLAHSYLPPFLPASSSSRRLSLTCQFFHQRPPYLLPSCNGEGRKGTIRVKMVTTVPVSGLVVKGDASGRCCLTDASC